MAAAQAEPEIKGLGLDDVLQNLDAIRDVVAHLQEPQLSLTDLETILDLPDLLPPGCSATRIGKCDLKLSQLGLDQELGITCDPQYYEDHSDSCELWVPASPLFPGDALAESLSEPKTVSAESFRQALAPALS